MSEGPHDGVNDQLELVRGHGEERVEAVIGDGPQQAEELQSVLRVVLHTQHHVLKLMSDPEHWMTCNMLRD